MVWGPTGSEGRVRIAAPLARRMAEPRGVELVSKKVIWPVAAAGETVAVKVMGVEKGMAAGSEARLVEVGLRISCVAMGREVEAASRGSPE